MASTPAPMYPLIEQKGLNSYFEKDLASGVDKSYKRLKIAGIHAAWELGACLTPD